MRSLELQAGPMSAGEILSFAANPYAADAVQLRRWVEQAKVKGLATPDVAYFLPFVARCLRPS